MKIEIPCMVGDTVFADLRENQKKKPKPEDLAECYVKTIEFDKCWPNPLFTVIREDMSVCHIGESDFDRFFSTEFGKAIFTKDQYFDLLGKTK